MGTSATSPPPTAGRSGRRQASSVLWLTGFGRFPGVPDNPTAHIARALAGRRFGRFEVTSDVLPVHFDAAEQRLAEGYERWRPRLAVHLGVASRRNLVSFERRAHNQVVLGCPDASGFVATDPRIDPAFAVGAARSTGVLLPPLVAALARAGFGARISNDAGAYLCNLSYWHGLQRAAAASWAMDTLFVHVPPVGATDPRSGVIWQLDRLVAAVDSALLALTADPSLT